jgi:hypothetical protein
LLVPISNGFRLHWPRPVVRILAILIFATPLLWAALKPLLGRLLYRSLGEVKLKPEVTYERQRWYWVYGIVMFLLLFQTAALLSFIQGFLGYLSHPPAVGQIPTDLPSHWRSWLWVGVMPCAYALMAPWCIRGREEARAYSVLVAQGVIFTVAGFSFRGVNYSAASEAWWGAVWFILQMVILGWATLAIIRGRKEHREYLAILRNLPREEA